MLRRDLYATVLGREEVIQFIDNCIYSFTAGEKGRSTVAYFISNVTATHDTGYVCIKNKILYIKN